MASQTNQQSSEQASSPSPAMENMSQQESQQELSASVSQWVTRSTRPRKQVDYSGMDPDVDDIEDGSMDESTKKPQKAKKRSVSATKPDSPSKQPKKLKLIFVSAPKTPVGAETDASTSTGESSFIPAETPTSPLTEPDTDISEPSPLPSPILKPSTPEDKAENGRGTAAQRAKVAKAQTPKRKTPEVRKKSEPKAQLVKKADEAEEAALVPAKPPPARMPPAMSTSRAAIAETLAYYRAYQTGAYTGLGYVSGFYLGECGIDRPHFDQDVVITRCGGHHGTVDGDFKQTSDVMSDDAQLEHFRYNMRHMIPFVLLVGSSNTDIPVKVPAEFNIMGWFQVTDIWGEIKDTHKTYMYRLERVRRAGNEAWWVAHESEMSPPVSGVKCSTQKCGKCSKPSKQVYQCGWMCLNPDCAAFWKVKGRSVINRKLVYNPDFLAERSEFSELIGFPFDLVPPEPGLTSSEAAVGGAFDRRMWKGMACSVCHYISPRRKWLYYQCDNCGRVVDLPQPALTMNQIRGPNTLPITGMAPMTDVVAYDMIKYSWWSLGHYVFRKFDLGHGNFVFHIQGNEHINAAPGGPNQMLHELQTDRSLGLERRSLGNKTGKSEGLVNHFSENYGYPYKYIVSQKSRPFRDAPSVILRALERCQWVAEEAIGKEKFLRFNEVLAVGYMQNGSMGYHDDGEKELGDTVVAMCIGGNATMNIRLKDQYYRGLGRKGTGVADHHLRVPDGALFKAEREALNAKYAGKPFDNAVKKELTQAMLAIHKGYGGAVNGPKPAAVKNGKKQAVSKVAKPVRVPLEAKPILELKFKHGDYFIMHGPDVQRFYEHGVSTDDKLRFALTCRHVMLESLEPKTKLDVAARRLGVYDISKFEYNGAMDGWPPTTTRSQVFKPFED